MYVTGVSYSFSYLNLSENNILISRSGIKIRMIALMKFLFCLGPDKNKNQSVLQLNEYETAPYFIQFSQNLTCDCLLISVFSP